MTIADLLFYYSFLTVFLVKGSITFETINSIVYNK